MRTINARRYTDKKRPNLKFTVNFREAGKRRRKFFETKEQAGSFAAFKNAELKKSGVEHAQFPERLRTIAQNATERLTPFGKSITDAVDHFVAHLKASEKSCTAADLVDELVAAKKADGKSQRHVDDLRSRLDIFAEEFDGQMFATITTKQINDWLRSLKVSAVTRNHYRRLIVLAYNFAVENGYATANPAEKTAKAKEDGGTIGILAVTQAARLLETATPDVLPYIAIGLFAGLRRAEIERLDWSEIDFESDLIEVTAKNAKTARRRHVTIQPNLREWLLPLRKHKGNVTPGENFRQLFDAARVAAGIEDWPDNALRHSFASYHLAHFKNAKALALELGHTNEDMIFTNYRQLVRPTEAERYWDIKPAKSKKKIVPMAATAA